MYIIENMICQGLDIEKDNLSDLLKTQTEARVVLFFTHL